MRERTRNLIILWLGTKIFCTSRMTHVNIFALFFYLFISHSTHEVFMSIHYAKIVCVWASILNAIQSIFSRAGDDADIFNISTVQQTMLLNYCWNFPFNLISFKNFLICPSFLVLHVCVCVSIYFHNRCMEVVNREILIDNLINDIWCYEIF